MSYKLNENLARAFRADLWYPRIKEASTGYFADYNKLRHEGGKMWIAPRTLIQEKVSLSSQLRSEGFSCLKSIQAALYFPEIEGISLEAKFSGRIHTSELLKGKVSLVAMLSTRVSEAHVESYAQPILDTFKADPKFQFIQLNCQENVLKWMLVGIFTSANSLKKYIPPELHSTYLISTQSLEYLREV